MKQTDIENSFRKQLWLLDLQFSEHLAKPSGDVLRRALNDEDFQDQMNTEMYRRHLCNTAYEKFYYAYMDLHWPDDLPTTLSDFRACARQEREFIDRYWDEFHSYDEFDEFARWRYWYQYHATKTV